MSFKNSSRIKYTEDYYCKSGSVWHSVSWEFLQMHILVQLLDVRNDVLSMTQRAEEPQPFLTHQKETVLSTRTLVLSRFFSGSIFKKKKRLTITFHKILVYLVYVPYFTITKTEVQERRGTCPELHRRGPFPTVFHGVLVSRRHTFMARATSAREILIGHPLGPFSFQP